MRKKIKISHPFYLVVFILGIMISCKGSQSAAEESPIVSYIILLDDSSSIDDLEVLEAKEIIKKAKTSRSQNLWTLQVRKSDDEAQELLKKIKNSSSVKSVKISKPSEVKVTNSKNVKQ